MEGNAAALDSPFLPSSDADTQGITVRFRVYGQGIRFPCLPGPSVALLIHPLEREHAGASTVLCSGCQQPSRQDLEGLTHLAENPWVQGAGHDVRRFAHAELLKRGALEASQVPIDAGSPHLSAPQINWLDGVVGGQRQGGAEAHPAADPGRPRPVRPHLCRPQPRQHRLVEGRCARLLCHPTCCWTLQNAPAYHSSIADVSTNV